MLEKLKMKKVVILSIATVMFFTTIVLAAPSKLRGKIVVDGSSTVYPVTEAAAADFRNDYPDINVTVAISGTGGDHQLFVGKAHCGFPLRSKI